jgi:hypothetical protein
MEMLSFLYVLSGWIAQFHWAYDAILPCLEIVVALV